MVQAAEQENADLVGVPYRLTPETGERLFGAKAEAANELHRQGDWTGLLISIGLYGLLGLSPIPSEPLPI